MASTPKEAIFFAFFRKKTCKNQTTVILLRCNTSLLHHKPETLFRVLHHEKALKRGLTPKAGRHQN